MDDSERSRIYVASYGGKRKTGLLGWNIPAPRGFDSVVSLVEQTLASGEIPRIAAWGKFSNGRFGLLVATDSRLIGINKGALTGMTDSHEIPYDMVRGISDRRGLGWGKITIQTFPSGYLSLETVEKEVAPAFAGWLRARIGSVGGDIVPGLGEHTTTASFSVNSRSLADELAKLATLRDSGVLTEAEFLEAKKQLLKG